MRAKLIIKSYLKINRVSRTVRCFRFKPHAFSQRIIFLRLNPACPFSVPFVHILYTCPTLQVVSRRARTEDAYLKSFSRVTAFSPPLFPTLFSSFW